MQGNVRLDPEILGNSQIYIADKLGMEEGSRPVSFVFHGGSGSDIKDIKKAITYGVVKMNIDTDTQWSYWNGIKEFESKNHDYLQTQIGNPEARRSASPPADVACCAPRPPPSSRPTPPLPVRRCQMIVPTSPLPIPYLLSLPRPNSCSSPTRTFAPAPSRTFPPTPSHLHLPTRTFPPAPPSRGPSQGEDKPNKKYYDPRECLRSAETSTV